MTSTTADGQRPHRSTIAGPVEADGHGHAGLLAPTGAEGALPPDAERTALRLPEGDTELRAFFSKLIRIGTKVALGDFSEKPPVVEGDDELAWFVVGFRFMLEDLERAHQERAEEIEGLRELHELKARFVNAAAHELNTPLTPLKTDLLMMRRGQLGPLTPRQQVAVERMDRSLRRLQGLVSDMLDVNRLESGRLVMRMVPCDLREAVAEATDPFRVHAKEQGVAVRTELPEALPVHADPTRMVQVFQNLLANAVKFTPDGGRVVVRGHVEDGEVRVEVRDTGIGIAADDIVRLFEPFVQVHEQVPRMHQGSGLGLNICRGIAEEHAGRIWCDSAGPGQGAGFHVALPLLPLDEDVGPGQANGSSMALSSNKPASRSSGPARP